ncbi:MAG: winged helix-turn-helix domain-containing protein [Candidatus Diapherotrites archaeon]|nr:winged helix-turn-helix domain-containing protein [Candidatus Diapherotrites archaeon]
MGKIKASGGSFRSLILENAGITQTEISNATGINPAPVSQGIKGARPIDIDKKKVIYSYYCNRVTKPVPYNVFWCPELKLEY